MGHNNLVWRLRTGQGLERQAGHLQNPGSHSKGLCVSCVPRATRGAVSSGVFKVKTENSSRGKKEILEV